MHALDITAYISRGVKRESQVFKRNKAETKKKKSNINNSEDKCRKQ